MITETGNPENEENKQNLEESQADSQQTPQAENFDYAAEIEALPEENPIEALSLDEILDELEKIVNLKDAGLHSRKFHQLRDAANLHIQEEIEEKKHHYVEEGNDETNFSYQHPKHSRLNALVHIYKEKMDDFHKKQEEEHDKNLTERLGIIESLKNLYTNSEPGTNLFKSIRAIKEAWSNAGQVAKSEFKNLNNNYFHHLKMFNEMLDLNKEYLEQEYSHNLEKRNHIIDRAKELLEEPLVQKALNELQYLHKLWKEEAEPVAEEFREKTWEEFKDISQKIHERKSELFANLEKDQEANLVKKSEIIQNLKKLANPSQNINHNYWQNAIKTVENLRLDFLKTGSVPKKVSNQTWTDFKQNLRTFNTAKNSFYKNLKDSQIKNLEAKLSLIKTAQDNMLSEDWETIVPLFKKLQEDWKNIGHVPRSQANKVWDDFREACNTFFKNFRDKNNATTDNWKENFKNKRALLDELKTISNEEGSIEKIEQIKNQWNAIGKVPKDKLGINTEFNKTLRDKLKLNKINEFDLNEENLTENQLTDKARKVKNQIADLEAEVVKLENNISFFSNASRENPLLKDSFQKLDDKKEQLESLKQTLHNIIANKDN